MSRYICKLDVDGEPKYFEWSTVVDAPVKYGMSLEEFTDYYREEYGEHGLRDLPERMKRVEDKGTSAILYDSIHELIESNRAGEDEDSLSVEEIAKILIPPNEG